MYIVKLNSMNIKYFFLNDMHSQTDTDDQDPTPEEGEYTNNDLREFSFKWLVVY